MNMKLPDWCSYVDSGKGYSSINSNEFELGVDFYQPVSNKDINNILFCLGIEVFVKKYGKRPSVEDYNNSEYLIKDFVK